MRGKYPPSGIRHLLVDRLAQLQPQISALSNVRLQALSLSQKMGMDYYLRRMQEVLERVQS